MVGEHVEVGHSDDDMVGEHARHRWRARPTWSGSTSRSNMPMSSWSASTSDRVRDHIEIGHADDDRVGEEV